MKGDDSLGVTAGWKRDHYEHLLAHKFCMACLSFMSLIGFMAVATPKHPRACNKVALTQLHRPPYT